MGRHGIVNPLSSYWAALVAISIALLAAMSALAGCEAADDDGPLTPADEFTPLELQMITRGLGILPKAPPPSLSNRYGDDPAAAELGQKFFFDLRLGIDSQTGCVTCHEPDSGFQDDRDQTSQGVGGFTRRHANTLINAAYGDGSYDGTPWQLWDGRADSLWAQALAPAEDSLEMGSSRTRAALLVYDLYLAEYEAVFGPIPIAMRDGGGNPVAPDGARPSADDAGANAAWQALAPSVQDGITEIYVNFGKALAAYERRLVSTNSRFDDYYRELVKGNLDSEILNAEERWGLRLFVGKGECIRCHSGPNFTAAEFWNIAVPQEGRTADVEDVGRIDGVELVRVSEFGCTSKWSDVEDPGLCEAERVDTEPRLVGAFKTPGLRDISKTAPYMHTGAFATLEDVVRHYNDGGAEAGFAGAEQVAIRELNLSEEEEAALVAFLLTLDGEELDPSLLQAPTLPR